MSREFAPFERQVTDVHLDEYDNLLAERALLRRILHYGVVAEDEADGLIVLSTASVYPLSAELAKTARRVCAEVAAIPKPRRRR